MHVVKANNPTSQSERGQQKQSKKKKKKWTLLLLETSKTLPHTMSFPNISLADCIWKVCLTNATKRKLQEIKLKLCENLKALWKLESIKLVKNCTKETSILPAIQKSRKWYGNA